MKRVLSGVGAALLSLFWPEHCLLCRAPAGTVRWTECGPVVQGLRSWDRPHLCASCRQRLRDQPRLRRVQRAAGSVLPLAAGLRTVDELVTLVGAVKYHGVRGAIWPLSSLALAGLPLAVAAAGPVSGLVAVPLHRRRRRARGFNQAELLARVLAIRTGIPYLPGALRRPRTTGQQAKLTADVQRLNNVQGAFEASPPAAGAAQDIAIIDDLVTSGATILAAAEALFSAGWEVRWGLAVGLAKGRVMAETSLDSRAARF